MKSIAVKPLRLLAALAIGAVSMNGVCAAALTPEASERALGLNWARHRQERDKVRLARMKSALDARVLQEDNWAAPPT